MRFTGSKDETWIGNFQSGHSYHSEVIVWREAHLFVVIAAGACYLVSAEDPERYVYHQSTVTGVLFNEDRTKMFVADYFDLYAYDRTGSVLWKCENMAVDGIELIECASGFVRGCVCYDPPEGWEDFKVSESTGQLIKP